MPSSAIALLLASATAMAAVAGLPYRPGYDSVFLVFFITLGPVKGIGDYLLATQELARREVVALDLKVFGLSIITILVAGLVGSMLLHKWHISTSTMQQVADIIFFVVAIRLVFAATVTPYGLAALSVGLPRWPGQADGVPSCLATPCTKTTPWHALP